MRNSIADFCDVEVQRLIERGCFTAFVEAMRITSQPPLSVEEVIGLFRLPRTVIEEAVEFTKQYAAVCVETQQELPTMVLPDPWDKQRQALIASGIGTCIDRIARLAGQRWGLPAQATAVSRHEAKSKLLKELAAKWEAGQRAYCQALQQCNAAPLLAKSDKPKALEDKAPVKRRRKRGKTTDERLEELANSEERLREAFANPTIDGVAALIDRSHGAVAGSAVWKKKIQPRLEALKRLAAVVRLEHDDRRLDRQSDRRRK